MTNPYNSANEIDAVVRGFDRAPQGGRLTHRDHLAVAVWYLRSDQARAADLMRASLHRFLDHYGCRENYHETLTLLWIQLVQRALEEMTPASSLLQATNAVVTRLGDSRLAFEYYSKELVGSETGKKGWVKPDLRSL